MNGGLHETYHVKLIGRSCFVEGYFISFYQLLYRRPNSGRLHNRYCQKFNRFPSGFCGILHFVIDWYSYSYVLSLLQH